MKQTEIRKTGYQALINALGVVGMLRFLQQLDIGSGDYTLERQPTPEPTLEEFQVSSNKDHTPHGQVGKPASGHLA